jgi:D-beta-D-heptose 7-phosphate kinase/D-beta-D-heptose 1-phosphate adenosyltransferase
MVVIFEEDTPLSLIKTLRPDVLVKGADYTREAVVGHELVEAWGGRIVLAPLIENLSTTGIVERVKGNSKQSGD